MKDAPLFERTRIASWGSLSTAACVDIACVYLESGDGNTALTWLEKVPDTESFMTAERDALLLEVFGRLGDAARQADTAWRIFRRSRSLPALERLLAILGSGQKDAVVGGEIANILAGKNLSLTDVAFLLAIGRLDEAETYLLKHAGQLNGDNYSQLLPLAETLEKDGRHLCASLLYRALLDSILRRAQTKIYPHGVRYLKKLDRLAGSVSDWRTIDTHSVYKTGLQLQHGRKSSFWSRYGD